MKDNIKSEPLLFIETITEEVVPNSQDIFDSRNKVKKVVKTKQHKKEFYVKIERLVLTYKKGKEVICKVKLLTEEEYEVIVTEKEENKLVMKKLDNNELIMININEIDELTIEKIN